MHSRLLPTLGNVCILRVSSISLTFCVVCKRNKFYMRHFYSSISFSAMPVLCTLWASLYLLKWRGNEEHPCDFIFIISSRICMYIWWIFKCWAEHMSPLSFSADAAAFATKFWDKVWKFSLSFEYVIYDEFHFLKIMQCEDNLLKKGCINGWKNKI